MPTPRLITIGPSHYCEKARWALERAGVAYVEECHAPVLHYAATLVRHGQRTTPILVTPHGTIHDSTNILRHADKFVDAGRRLFPEEEPARSEVAELVDRFDRRLGPATRRLAYFHVLDDSTELRCLIEPRIPAVERVLFRALRPVIVAFIKKGLRIDAEGARRSEARVFEVFDEVETRLARGGRYLVGERLTAADLTFAALAAPLLLPLEYGWPLPSIERGPPTLRALSRRVRARKAGSFGLALYHDERQRSLIP
jgi:glutathione S-transferase